MVETIVSTVLGYLVALALLYLVNAVWNLHLALADNLVITGLFTIASLARGYLVRRFFNWYHATHN
jgi:hypothetical protein